MPQPVSFRLSLSGGGFRASYFHLGALYALGEQGKLVNLDVIVSVSGGSIAAAMYLHALSAHTGPIDAAKTMDAAVAALEALIRHTRVSPRHKAFGSVRSLSRVLAYEEFGTSMAMERQYAAWLRDREHTFPRDSHRLPEWRIATSDYLSGECTLLVFNDRHLPRSGNARYLGIDKHEIARAVSASSAVPGIFAPVSWTGSQGELHRLGDGGVLDNQGLRELGALSGGPAVCICVDASARLQRLSSASGWATFGRAVDMLMEQTRSDSMRHNIELLALRETPDIERPEWWKKLADLRTDLDDFSLIEIYLLFLAGYQSVAGPQLPAPCKVLEPARQLWKMVIEPEMQRSTERASLYAEVLGRLERGRYLIAAGIRAPDTYSVLATLGATYMSASFGIVVLAYMLLVAALSSRFLQPYVVSALWRDVLLWMLATGGLVWYQMSGRRKAPSGPGVWPRLWRAWRIVSSPVLLPVLLLFAAIVKSLAFFSERSSGDRALLKRIDKAGAMNLSNDAVKTAEKID